MHRSCPVCGRECTVRRNGRITYHKRRINNTVPARCPGTGAEEVPGSKRCYTCGKLKPLEQFRRHRSRFDGRNAQCTPCAKHASQAYPSRTPRIRRAKNLRSYRLTEESYNRLLASQGGVCALCGALPYSQRASGKPLAVDHDHACCPLAPSRQYCGKCVRGLLCVACNTWLGVLEPKLPAITEYLSQYVRRRETSLPEEETAPASWTAM